jgi:hypothetical protein
MPILSQALAPGRWPRRGINGEGPRGDLEELAIGPADLFEALRSSSSKAKIRCCLQSACRGVHGEGAYVIGDQVVIKDAAKPQSYKSKCAAYVGNNVITDVHVNGVIVQNPTTG